MTFKGENRQSDIKALSSRVGKRAYNKYLSRVRLVRIRGFENKEISFDFPVTALVGPNGAGKTTVMGAAGLIYRKVLPRRFFAKSGKYDESMKNWRVEYEIVDKRLQPTTLTRTASYLNAKWNRDAVEREVLVFGVSRTLPASERKELSKFIGSGFSGVSEELLTPPVVQAVERILAKDAASYLKVDADRSGKLSIFASQAIDGANGYSEFHFGAGEASVIRIVSRIESAADEALILIEEIENGLHPVATRRLVDYLIDVAKRKSCQIIFTTHSNDALFPLPDEAVWVSYRGELSQGKLDVASLRALTGQIDARLAVFTEDRFGELLADITLRIYTQRHGLDRTGIEVHKLGGAAPARDHTRFHNANPVRKFPAVCLLDGDKRHEDGFGPQNVPGLQGQGDAGKAEDVLYIPGEGDPEEHVIQRIVENFDKLPNLLGKLTLSLQLDTFMQSRVRESTTQRAFTNYDRHSIFAQIGEDLDFLSEEVVQRAFITTWAYSFPEEVDSIWDPSRALIEHA